ncbi:MAG: type II secretion system F family protein [Candidatus Norongarragalinales archaeon]
MVFGKALVWWRQLKDYYEGTGISFSFPVFILVFFFVALLVFLILAALRLTLITSLLSFVAVMSMVVAIPINLRDARIAAIEDALPDALKHMAFVLRAGGTTESALSEVANANYGLLSKDFKNSLHAIREGKPFNEVLLDQARRSGSLLFKRTATIIIDARRAGAGIADVMFQIAEDARDVSRIKRERYSRTTMHVIFLVTAALLLAPFIFGFTISIVNYINTGITGALPNAPKTNMCELNALLLLFIAVQTVITSIAIGIIREGKTIKYILYAPLMVLMSLLVFEAGKWFSLTVVGGAGLVC